MHAGYADAAVALGRDHLATCHAQRLSPTHRSMARVTSEALLAAGRLSEARELAASLVDEFEREGVRGVHLALAYETLATAGMLQGDVELFERAAARCDRESKRYPALRARYERLLREAVERGVRSAQPSLAVDADQERNLRALELRLSACLDRNERAHAVLLTLIDAAGATGGFLYGLQSGTLEVIAHCASVQGETASRGTAHNAAPWPQPSQRIRALAESTLAEALETQSAATLSAAALHTLEPGAPASPDSGDALVAFVLASSQGAERALAAIAVLIVDGDRQADTAHPATGLLELLGSTLLDQDDVDPVTRVA
jgi:hypothetical protein